MARSRIVIAASLLVLAAALLVAAATAGHARWDPVVLGILLVLVLVSDAFEARVAHMQLSGAFLGLLLAMAILGPAPSAAIGLATALCDGLRARPRRAALALNVACWTAFPTAGAAVMAWLAGTVGVSLGDPASTWVLLAGFASGITLNFALCLVALKVLDGTPVQAQLRELLSTLLPSVLTTALLAAIVLFAYREIGTVALGLLGGLFFLYLWLLRELLLSQDRARELDRRTRELAALQVGVLTTMLKTLALRDHMTARHSAAVGRYARALAREAGCTEREQELVHTAGLLHDIGKFIFPDRILLANTKLDDGDWEIVKRHPYQGARLVGQIEGYGPVAEIILAHHERVDGRGYPRGLGREQIPLLSRMISIADTYDVMTSRDSYRAPVPPAAALAELRRVAGRQLDARLVELFVAMHERGELGFRHGDDADFEAEIQFERRVSEYAAPRPHLRAA